MKSLGHQENLEEFGAIDELSGKSRQGRANLPRPRRHKPRRRRFTTVDGTEDITPENLNCLCSDLPSSGIRSHIRSAYNAGTPPWIPPLSEH